MTRALFWLVCHGLDNSGSKKVRIDREFNIVYGPNLLSSVNTYCLSYQTQPTCPVGRFSVSFNMLSKSKISQKWSRFYDLIQSFAFKIKLYLKIQGMQILYQISLETHGLTSTTFFLKTRGTYYIVSSFFRAISSCVNIADSSSTQKACHMKFKPSKWPYSPDLARPR